MNKDHYIKPWYNNHEIKVFDLGDLMVICPNYKKCLSTLCGHAISHKWDKVCKVNRGGNELCESCLPVGEVILKKGSSHVV